MCRVRAGMKLLLLAALGFTACAYSPELGGLPFACGPADPQCPDGYACVSGVCTDGTDVGSGTGSGSGSGTGSGSGMGSGSGSGTSCAFTGVLASWDFTGESGDQTSTAAKTTATGVTALAVTRASGLTPQSAQNSMSSSGWPTGSAIDKTKYYTVAITPPSGCTIALSQATVSMASSGTGPAKAAIGTSADAFAATTALSVNGTAMPNVTASSSVQLEVRVFGYNASAANGTMRLQTTLSISGSIQ